jgi:UDP-GlcNAc:undecaprenyl-phosphate GlcNAc-1-phosphate transferase
MPSVSNTNLTLISLVFFSFVSSLLINYILLKFARTLGIRNKSSYEIRWDPNHKPSLGGISFYLNFLFSFIFLVLINPDFNTIKWVVFGFLLSGSLAFLMGLSDDAFNTQPLLKLITQIICALILLYSGVYIKIFENTLINYALTIVWVIAMMNSFNLLDNMDGITGIISLVISAFFVIISVSLKNTNSYIAIFNICLSGALIGFLFYNFHPSKMYMGDSGSQFLGLFLAAIGIEICWNNNFVTGSDSIQLENICLVLLVYLLPIVDTTTVFINRIRKGTSPFIGGKDHTTHHLFFKGITEKRIAILYFFISFVACIIACKMILNYSTGLVYMGISYVAIVFLFLYLNTIIKKR